MAIAYTNSYRNTDFLPNFDLLIDDLATLSSTEKTEQNKIFVKLE